MTTAKHKSPHRAVRCFHPLILVAVFLFASCGAVFGSHRSQAPKDPLRALYESRCGTCHTPFPSHAYSDVEWEAAVDKMAPRAGLTREEIDRISNWLKENN